MNFKKIADIRFKQRKNVQCETSKILKIGLKFYLYSG